MSTAAVAQPHAEQGASPATCRFGMVIFLVSEGMLFAGLIAAYMVLRMAHPGEWPPPGFPSIQVQWPLVTINIVMIINTVILVSSSFTFHFAEAAVKKGRTGLLWLLVTVVFGAIFLSVQAYEWMHLHHEGLWFNSGGIYGSCFFVLTGFHGAHVFIGLLLILWCLLRQLFTRCFSPEAHTSLENVGLYWHFVDVVWVGLFGILYVL